MENREDRFILSNLNKMLDRIEQIMELSWDVEYSSLDLGCDIESKLDELEEIFRGELSIKEQVLLRDWNHETGIPA